MIGAWRYTDPVRVLSWRRAAVALGAGLIAGAPVALAGAEELSPLVVWIVATLLILVWVWRIIWPQDASDTKQLAEAEG